MAAEEIRYVARSELDTAKWDHCLDNAMNSIIYGYSFYLDKMAKQWDALVLGDYDAVMPVTWNRKMGIKYLHQPALTQQLGIFSSQKVSHDLIDRFLREIQLRFRFAEIFFNYGNSHPHFRNRCNLVLSLAEGYSKIFSNYKADAVRNITRSKKFGLTYKTDVDLDFALQAYQAQYSARLPHLKDSDFGRFKKVCKYALEHDELIARGIQGPGDKTLAVAVLLKKKNRLYLVESTTFPEGKKVEANYYLIDRLIQEFAGSDLLLDFEGSDVPGIAYFYKNFGSVEEPYFFYRYNRLPFFVRQMKPLH